MNTIDLIVDCEHRRLVNARGEYINEPPVFVRGDDQLLRIRFVTVNRDSSPFTLNPASFDESSLFYFCGKASYAGPALVLSDPDQWNIEGDWEDADIEAGKCSCRVNFNGESLLSAIGSNGALRMFFDLSVTAPNGLKTTMLLLDIPLQNDVHRGSELVPDPVGDYPTTDDLNNRISPGIRLIEEDGGMAIYVGGIKRGII